MKLLRFSLLFFSLLLFAQENLVVEQIKENQGMMKSDREKGFNELLILEKKAHDEQNAPAELEILNNKAFYYFIKGDYDEAYSIAKVLVRRANSSKNSRLYAIGLNRQGIVLSFLHIYDEAEKTLLQSQNFLSKNSFPEDYLVKAQNYQLLSDYYTHTSQPEKALDNIKKTIPEYLKISDEHERQNQPAK